MEHIIVLGHQKCGGIRALVERRLVRDERDDTVWPVSNDFIDSWVSIADKAVEKTRAAAPRGLASLEAQCEHCELAAIDVSLANLMTFPWVEARVQDGSLQLHGWRAPLPPPPSPTCWFVIHTTRHPAPVSGITTWSRRRSRCGS